MGKQGSGGKKGGVGTAALVLGAAGLLLFIVGVKRRYDNDEFSLDTPAPHPRQDKPAGAANS